MLGPHRVDRRERSITNLFCGTLFYHIKIGFLYTPTCFHTLTILLKYNSGLVSQYKSDKQNTEAKNIGRKIKACFIISTHLTSIRDFRQWGVWVVQLHKYLILGFDTASDLRVLSWTLVWGSELSTSLLVPLPPPLPLPLLAISLYVSKNK